MIHMKCEIISNCQALKRLNEFIAIAYTEFSELVRLYTLRKESLTTLDGDIVHPEIAKKLPNA